MTVVYGLHRMVVLYISHRINIEYGCQPFTSLIKANIIVTKKHTVMELLRNSLPLHLIYKIFKVRTSLFKLIGFFAQNKVQYTKCDIQKTKDLNTEIGTFSICFFISKQNIFNTCQTHSKYRFNSTLCV